MSTPKFPRFRRIVENAPIVGFTGVNGAGKSLLMHSENVADLARGRRVYSTTPIRSPWGNSEPLRSLRQLLELENCIVSIDEVAAVFPSSGGGELPFEVNLFLQGMRHQGEQGVILRWAAPAWSRAAKQLREVTQVCVTVTPLMRYRVADDFWPKARLVMAGALDCTSVKLDDDPTKVIARRIYRTKALPGFGMYDHKATISRIGWPKAIDVCADCGGRTKTIYCTPERHDELGIAAPLRFGARPAPVEEVTHLIDDDQAGDDVAIQMSATGEIIAEVVTPPEIR